MDSNLDQRNWWDEVSCREFEAFLDELHMEKVEREHEEMERGRAVMQWEKDREELGEF